MKKIRDIRLYISNIPGAFLEFLPENADRSNDPAIRTLWDTDNQDSCDSDTSILQSKKYKTNFTIFGYYGGLKIWNTWYDYYTDQFGSW